jgi:hypothetical protein
MPDTGCTGRQDDVSSFYRHVPACELAGRDSWDDFGDVIHSLRQLQPVFPQLVAFSGCGGGCLSSGITGVGAGQDVGLQAIRKREGFKADDSVGLLDRCDSERVSTHGYPHQTASHNYEGPVSWGPYPSG